MHIALQYRSAGSHIQNKNEVDKHSNRTTMYMHLKALDIIVTKQLANMP